MECKRMSVNSGTLPNFLRGVQIVGPAHVEMQKYREKHASLAVSSEPTKCEVNVYKSPTLLASKDVKSAYQRNDFAAIKNFEKKAQDDLQAVYQNIADNKENAWTKLKSEDGTEFYASWSKTGMVWTQTINTINTSKDTKQCVVQFGTYSQSTSILGVSEYNLTIPVMVTEGAIALIVALGVSGIVAQGLGFAVAAFSLLLANAAAALGFASFSFVVPVAGLFIVATALVFAIVFIGLVYLWNFLNRKYTIRLQIFNWDNNDWSANGQYISNAKFCGVDDDPKKLNFTLPKLIKPDDVVTPPGFTPVVAMDSVCFYATMIWENDNTFMEGCSMAVKMQKNENEGFMWAFSCPRFTDNQQAADDGLKDPEYYRNHCTWNKSPLKFSITSSNIPVYFALSALHGASDGLYDIMININDPLV